MFWNKKKSEGSGYKYSKDRHYNVQGTANWNVSNARRLWTFVTPIAITSFQTDSNTLGIRFPDAYGTLLGGALVSYPLESVEDIVAGFTTIRGNDPSQIQTSRGQFHINKSWIVPPIITRSIEFISFGASGIVAFSFSYYLCFTD